MSNTTLNKILVPIGFSEQSIRALQHAVHLARRMEAEIIILSVLEDVGLWARLFDSEVEEQTDRLKEEVSAKLDELIAMHRDSQVNMSQIIAKGTVYEEVARVADMLDVDLVVMGTNGKPSNFRKAFIGSNAYRVVNMVEPPVITVRGVAGPRDFKRIIFPLVMDAQSREKVGVALHYARMFDSEIHIVGITTNDDEARKIAAQVAQVQKFVTDAGVKCTSKMQEGKSAAQATLDYATEVKGDLIIIMDEGDSARGLKLVSTHVEKIIYSADIPVMSVTPSRVKYAAQFANF